MTLSAGAVETIIGANISGLEDGVRRAEAEIRRYAAEAERILDSAFDGAGMGEAARKAASDVADAARKGMESKIGAAGDAFRRGLIDAEGLERRAREAGTSAAREVERGFDRLTGDGLIPDSVGRDLTRDLTDAARRAGARAGDAAAASFRDRFSQMGAGIGRIGESLQYRIGLPLALAGGLAAREAVQLQSLERGMVALAGSADEAAEAMQDLREIAELPGIDFRESISGYNRLRAVRTEAELAKEALRQVANAVALSGGGATELSGVVRQLSQIQSLGRLMGEELNVILENAPALATALQNAFGTTSAEQIRELGLSAEEFMQRFVDGAATLPRVTAGAREEFEEMRAEIGLAAATIGEEMLPALSKLAGLVTGTSEGVQGLDRDTARWVVAIGGATVGTIALTRAIGGARLAMAGLSTQAALASGGLTVAIGAIGAAFVKMQLDALDAERQIESFRQTVEGFSAFSLADALGERNQLESRIALVREAREQLEAIERAQLNSMQSTRSGFAAPLSAQQRQTRDAMQAVLDAAPPLEELEKALVRINERITEIQSKPPRPGGAAAIIPPNEIAAAEEAVDRLAEAVRNFPPPRELVADVSEDAVALGLAERALAEFEQARAALNERAARGIIDAAAMEAGAANAARAYNRALLAVLDQWTLTPEIRAEIQARLQVEVERVGVKAPETGASGEEDDWRDFAEAASVAVMGVVNVADAFGELSDGARRALTGVSELARGVGQIQGGALFTAGNIPGLVGIAGGVAQLAAAAFAPDEEAKRVTQENTRALERLRREYESQTRGDLTRGIGLIDNIQRISDPFQQFQAIARNMDTLGPLLDEFGISLEKNAFQGLAQLEEALREASGRAFEFANTLDGFRAKQSALDEIFDRSGAETELQRAYDALGQFAPELLAQLGGLNLDLSSAAGRDELERVLREAITQYAEGSLDLSLLDRFESGDDFVELLLSLDRPLDQLKDQLNAVTSAASNVPPIFDVELRRRQALMEGVGGVGPADALRGLAESIPDATAAVDGWTDAIIAAWARIGATANPTVATGTIADATTTMGAAGVRDVHIHNPPAGMDVRETARQVKAALLEDYRRGGASETSVILRSR